MVLVDTPVWSLVLRRRPADLSTADRSLTQNFLALVRQRQAQLLGSSRQEVLSGIREENQFRRIRDYLRAFPDVSLHAADYEDAAQAGSQCRRAGIATSPVDMLMCAVALRNDWQIFTTDRDFTHYHQVLKVKLFAAK